MAGSMAMVAANDHSKKHTMPATTTRNHWHQIDYSRFFSFPTHNQYSSCPPLAPPPRRARGVSNTGGTWISTSSPIASLLITSHRSPSDSILTVSYRDKILEEHYISKLQFSWPQVSCVSGYPARGSRILFVSYLDSSGKIQKFSLRFPTVYEAEAFINALNEILKVDEEPKPLPTDLQSEISSHSELMPSNRLHARAREEELSIMKPQDTYIPQLPPGFSCEVEQAFYYAQETKSTQNSREVSPSLPPSFTSLLASCHPEVNPVGMQPTLPEEVDLKSQIVKYMEDSSFQDMLCKVEKVMKELDGDLTV